MDSSMIKMPGRPKGSPNKKTEDLQFRAEELGIEPFEVLLLFAKRDWKALGLPEFTQRSTGKGEIINELSISPEAQMQAAAKACEYLYPKRKAIQLEESGPDRPITIRLAYSNED